MPGRHRIMSKSLFYTYFPEKPILKSSIKLTLTNSKFVKEFYIYIIYYKKLYGCILIMHHIRSIQNRNAYENEAITLRLLRKI